MAASAQLSRRPTQSVFHRRAFWLLWPAQLVSTAGSSLAALAASILVYQQTRSALGVGLMLVAAALPGLVVGLFATDLTSRVARKDTLRTAGLARVVFLLLIPVLLPRGLAWLYLLILLESAATQFYDPAYAGTLAQMTSLRELAAANPLLQIGRFGATAVGFVCAGILATRATLAGQAMHVSLVWAFYAAAAACALSALSVLSVTLARLPADHHVPPIPHHAAQPFASLARGARALRVSPALRSLLVLSLPAFLGLGLTNALLLPFTQRALHATWWQYGLQEALTALGFLVGSLLLARLGSRFHEGQLLTVGFLGMALPFVWYSQLTTPAMVPLALGLMALAGVFNALPVVGRTHLIQRYTSRDDRAPVTSLFFVVRSLCFLIGMAAAGLADRIAVHFVLLAGSLLLLLVGLLAFVAPGLRQSAQEWRRGLRLLRGVGAAPGLGAGRTVTAVDLDLLSRRWPATGELSVEHLQKLKLSGRVYDVVPGTRIVRAGERSTSAFFILRGRVVIGRIEGAHLTSSATLSAGDFFGEIAALTAAPRTADVVAALPGAVLEIPAATLRELMSEDAFSQQVLSRMTRRLVATQGADLPREVAPDDDPLTALEPADTEEAQQGTEPVEASEVTSEAPTQSTDE